ncbi:MAG: hypothetical protein LBS17_06660 [Actinomycetes bacterium]|nr:hypothetical protein [Actinomycetes bacterium]
MATNGVPTAYTASIHGGYTTTTTKCAVCHSAHRAISKDNINRFLTTSSACEQCHTDYGTGTATKIIEWAQVNGSGGSGGPHDTVGGCSACHKGGIHGAGNSAYWGMNAFMLGAEADAQITAEVINGNNNNINIDTNLAGNGSGTNWFVNGVTTSPDQGAVPTDLVTVGGSTVYATAKATATGYTCGRSGCHEHSTLSINRWGTTLQRDTAYGLTGTTGHASPAGHKADYPNASSGADNPSIGDSNAGGNVSANTALGWEPSRTTQANGQCAPCHPGGSILCGPTGASVNAPTSYSQGVQGAATTGSGDVALVGSARTYGCDQCHDMVGVSTGTTAFPHGNRGIKVYEFTWNSAAPWSNVAADLTANLTRSETLLSTTGGNLWMYASNCAYVDDGRHGQADVYTNRMDKDITVLENTVTDGTNVASTTDTVCLKCHVPVDAVSVGYWRSITGLDGSPSAPLATDGSGNLDLHGTQNNTGSMIGHHGGPASNNQGKYLYIQR